MTACVALIRGINVGRAKRIAMAELRDMVERQGHENVRTLLNSGNVVFDAKRANTAKIALALRKGIEERFGIAAHVVVVTAAELRATIDENPCKIDDPARFLVAFVDDPALLGSASGLAETGWAPETLAIGKRAAYIGCPTGIHDSKLLQAFSRATGGVSTARNWSTVLKLSEAAAR